LAAPLKNKFAEGKGRPTKYLPEYDEQAYKLCLLGATDAEMASFFDVDESTINNWKKDYLSFFESIKRGKFTADSNVADSLYKRACGYEHEEDDIKIYTGEVIITPTIKHYPPDPTSLIFWLKNRQPEKWRDKQEIDHSNKGEKFEPIDYTQLDESVLRAITKASKPKESQD
jgi:hypothetical protein